MKADNITGPVAGHGEGPCWAASWGGLRFVDLARGEILELVDGGVSRLSTGRPVASFIRPRINGGYVVGVNNGIGLSDHNDFPPETFIKLLSDSRSRMNDGGTGPEGTLFAGSMAYDGTVGGGRFFEIDAAHGSRTVLTRISISNGIAFDSAGTRAYYTDSATGRVDLFDYVDGELLNRRMFIEIEPDNGEPDGLTTDSEGNLWVSIWGGSEVRAYSELGQMIERVQVPTRQVSACTFGGPDLSTLFITSSSQGLRKMDDEAAGSLFVAHPGVSGLPVIPFGG